MAQNAPAKLESAEASLSKPLTNTVEETQMVTLTANQVGGKQIAEMRQSAPAVESLPALSINSAGEKPGYLAVARELAKGAVNELVEHPGRVLGNAAMGVAIGVGTALAAPEIAVGAAVVGVGAAAYGAYKYGSEWLSSAKTVANPSGKSEAEQLKARQTLQEVGGGATDMLAGAMGGLGAAIGTTAIKNVASRVVGKVAERTIEVLSFGQSPKFTPEILPSPVVNGAKAALISGGAESTRKLTSW